MLDATQTLPDDPAELRLAAERLVALAKTQALRIAKLEHQLAGLRRQRFGATVADSWRGRRRQAPFNWRDQLYSPCRRSAMLVSVSRGQPTSMSIRNCTK